MAAHKMGCDPVQFVVGWQLDTDRANVW